MDTLKWLVYKTTHPIVLLYWKIAKPVTYGARAILACDDEILLVRNLNAKHWSLPGGRIDKGETPEECVIREIREEVTIEIPAMDFQLGEYISNQEGKRDTIYIFVKRLLSKEFQKQWEINDAAWFSLDTLPEKLSPAASRRIAEFLRNERNLKGKW